MCTGDPSQSDYYLYISHFIVEKLPFPYNYLIIIHVESSVLLQKYGTLWKYRSEKYTDPAPKELIDWW
jgi:hypothetical protein